MPVHPEPFEPGIPCWADVLVDDLDVARQFYGGLFGWTFDDLPPEAGGYVMARKDGHVVAGALAKNADDPGQVNAWTLYLATDDVDAATQRATAAGGVLFLGPMDVLDVGRIAVGADAAGAAFGLWEARQHTGTDLVDEAGALCWAETMSRDYAASKAFYTDVFGYRLQEIGEGDVRYSVASIDGGPPVGGIGEIPAAAPAEMPSHWMVYFAVESCDDAARRVTQLGGLVVQQPFDTPYGRMAVVAGPQGETFSVMHVTPSSDWSHDPARAGEPGERRERKE